MAAVSDVETLAQALLSDVSQETYTDAVLLPFIASNYRKLQRRLRAQGISIMQAKSDVAESAAATTVTQPADFVAPIFIWEKATGEANDTYIPMKQVSTLPSLLQDSGPAIYWAWEDAVIKLIGSSAARTYRLLYEQSLADLTASANTLAIPQCVDALSYMTASDAARSRGTDKLAGDLWRQAEQCIDDLIRNQTKVNQNISFRQARYGRRWPMRYRF